MVVLAQLVRAPDCGSGGRGFEPHIPPVYKSSSEKAAFFDSKQAFPDPTLVKSHINILDMIRLSCKGKLIIFT